MSEENNDAAEKAAEVAARRRRRKSGEEPPPLPTPAPEVTDKPVDPNGPMAHRPGQPVLVASSLAATFAAQVYTGLTAARIPAGDLYGAGRQPLVQPMSNSYGVIPHADNYVTAEFDAHESMVPQGARQPVSRLLWLKGWRVRKDFYEAVCARRSPADQEAARLSPAKLPEGVTDPPPELTTGVATETASPVIR
jgi:hypothetical protein